MSDPGSTASLGRKGREVEWRAGVQTVLHVASSTGAQQLCVMEQWVEPGAGAPLHTHFEVEEVILVVEGEATFTADGELSPVGAGESIRLPAHGWHGFTNPGRGILHTVAVFAAPAPPVEYETEPGVVYTIGGTGEARHDAHRAIRAQPGG
jgi:mannose-6-phosphate isomerase-like protein (cupin superfamily)